MHCECCDKLLDNLEATARFYDENKDNPPRYVGMCTKCRDTLPRSIRILLRRDLLELSNDTAESAEGQEWDLENYDDDESW